MHWDQLGLVLALVLGVLVVAMVYPFQSEFMLL
jgi:hypothetical protein